jgi:hypothetical protein
MKGYTCVHQLGFVVEDLDKAMDEYGKIYRVKKWYHPKNAKFDMYYKGVPFVDEGHDFVVGFCGKNEIELIHTSAKENIYTGFLKENGQGLHHVSFFVKNLDKYVKEYCDMGFEVTQHGTISGSRMVTRFAYLTKPGERYGRVIEFSEVSMGWLRLMRNGHNMWFGVLTGDLELVR